MAAKRKRWGRWGGTSASFAWQPSYIVEFKMSWGNSLVLGVECNRSIAKFWKCLVFTNLAEWKESILKGYFWTGRNPGSFSLLPEKKDIERWVLKQTIVSNFDPSGNSTKTTKQELKKKKDISLQRQGEQTEDNSRILLEAGKQMDKW